MSIVLNNRDNSLNLIRLSLATFVLLGHCYFFVPVANNLPYWVNYLFSLAVPGFFIISGYLITASAIKNDLLTYFKKRFARIYPAYLVFIVTTAFFFAPLVYTLNGGGTQVLLNYINLNPSPLRFILYGLPLFLFSPDIGQTATNISGAPSWNASVWTLIFEFGCYITIKVLILIFQKFNIKKKNYLRIISSLYLVLVVISFFYPRPDVFKRDLLNLFCYSVNLFSVFLGGSILFLIKDKIVFSWKYFIVSVLICIFIMSFKYCLAIELSAIFLGYIIMFIAQKLKSPNWIKENDISYGVYIYGWPIQTFLITYSHIGNVFLFMLVSWVVVALFSMVSWFLVEKPILDKVR